MKNRNAVALGKLGGKVGGISRSETKAQAARANGKLGGRPRVMSESVDLFGVPQPLMEMARLGNLGQYSVWVCSEPLKNPSFHLKHKTDFEIVVQVKDMSILEIKHNKSRFDFKKGQKPPKAIVLIIEEFMSGQNEKDPSRTNADAFSFAWKLLND